MNNQNTEYSQIVAVMDASLKDLQHILLMLDPESLAFSHGTIRMLYLQSKTDELETFLNSFPTEKTTLLPWNILLAIGKLRLAIRRGQIKAETIKEALALRGKNGIWDADIAVVSAMAYETNGSHIKAKALYLEAYRLFSELHLKNKATICYLNAIAAQSRIEPHKKYFYEYEYAFQLAKDADDTNSMGVALSNLAREFHLMGSTLVALKKIEQALAILKPDYFGTYQYYMALSNRCHFKIELKRIEQALTDFQELLIAELPEIKYNVKVLKKLFEEAGVNVDCVQSKGNTLATNTWKKRRNRSKLEIALDKSFTDLEQLLLKLIAEKPRDKEELMELLYGEGGDYLQKENRLKQLLFRVRKKTENSLRKEEGKYKFIFDQAVSDG